MNCSQMHSYLSVSFSDWGHPEYGCNDNSDKIKDADKSNASNPCGGKDYPYYDLSDAFKWIIKNGTATWEKWFYCSHNGICIPDHLRCDSRAHWACTYQEGNKTIAQDEEHCPDRQVFYHLKNIVVTIFARAK